LVTQIVLCWAAYTTGFLLLSTQLVALQMKSVNEVSFQQPCGSRIDGADADGGK
jgi:hypothetical protein